MKEQGNVEFPDRPCGGRGICGTCGVKVEGLGEVLSCQFRVSGRYHVQSTGKPAFDVVMGSWNPLEKRFFCHPSIAIDIGTTTVAIEAVYGMDHVVRTFVNPQRAYGADVMSRIAADIEGYGSEMRGLLWERLVHEIELAAKEIESRSMESGLRACRQVDEDEERDWESGLERTAEEVKEKRGGLGLERTADGVEARSSQMDSKVWHVAVGGNTTMLHILLGYSCEGLGKTPFQPVSLGLETRTYRIGERKMKIWFLPGISAYLGADLCAGIYALEINRRRELSLLLDLGTNGEMVLGSRKRLLCASAAAGPAFEGSETALRLHASGIMSILRRMRRLGVMDGSGLLSDPYFEAGYPAGAGLRITQEEIRLIQMAKAAIRAGMEILIEEYGCSVDEIQRIYLAGGMGYYLNPEDASAIGLFPKGLEGKVRAVGNSCLSGAMRFLWELENKMDPDEMLAKIAGSAEEIILANHRDFEERYIGNMDFP